MTYKNGEITAEIKCSNFFELYLDFMVVPNRKFIKRLDPSIKHLTMNLFKISNDFKSYLKNVSSYLKKNIKYTDENLPQDTVSVHFNKKANCVGYSNLVSVFLDSAGIKNRTLKGFYLKQEKNNTLIPIPHRWVEIYLPNKLKFFYDPQYQNFSVNYIVVRENVNFKRVKKFRIKLITKSKKLIN